MKRFKRILHPSSFILALCLLALCLSMGGESFAAGTCTGTPVMINNGGANSYTLTLSCTSDSSAGTVAWTMSDDDLAAVKNYFNIETIIVPGAVTPSDGFDIYIYTDNSITVASSTTCSQTSNTELSLSQYRIVTGKWSLAAANCGNSKTFSVIQKFCCAK